MKEKKVAIYRSTLLKYSETFILKQAESLRRWNYCLVGEDSSREGLDLSGSEVVILGESNFIARKAIKRISQYLGARPCATSKLKNLDIDVLHIHFGTDAVDFWPAVRSLDVPIFITLHGYDIQIYKKWWQSGMGGHSRKHYPDRLIEIGRDSRVTFLAVSNAVKQQAIGFGLPEEKVKVSYIGIDDDDFMPSNILCSERRDILFVGRLVEKKGCQYLLDAFRLIKDDFPDTKITVAGDGPLRGGLEKFAQANNINADFLGAVSGGDVASLMRQARVFCLPSIRAENGDAEGFGLVILEAQASGVPVITSAEGGRQEGIIHGKTGFSHEERDVQALSMYLRRLLSDDDLANEFSKKAREFVSEKLKIADCTDALEKLYDKALY